MGVCHCDTFNLSVMFKDGLPSACRTAVTHWRILFMLDALLKAEKLAVFFFPGLCSPCGDPHLFMVSKPLKFLYSATS